MKRKCKAISAFCLSLLLCFSTSFAVYAQEPVDANTVEQTNEPTTILEAPVPTEETKEDPVAKPGTPVTGVTRPQYLISKSKTATELTPDLFTNVTLSLPAGEQQIESDIVFCLDKSTSADLETQALGMLKNLQGAIQQSGAKVKVGIVIFNRQANTFGWFDLGTQYAEIKNAIETEIRSGTNTHAGLMAANAMLDADTSVAPERKYMIFISDAITYMFDAVPNAIASMNGDKTVTVSGPDSWGIRHSNHGGQTYIPENWNQYLGDIEANLDLANPYVLPYDTIGETGKTNYIEYGNEIVPNTVDLALYKTYKEYENMSNVDGYNCYAMLATGHANDVNPWGPSFMDFLSGNKVVDFKSIQNDINYLVDSKSRVEDYIGYTDEYNFDFVDEASALKLTVGKKEYKAVKKDGVYTFANGTYTLKYEPGTKKADEHFILNIGTEISYFEPVRLTYTLQLMNPQSESGTYGQYDADGSQNRSELYTNNSAILYPVDSNGNKGPSEEFLKPTVSYTVCGIKISYFDIDTGKQVHSDNIVKGIIKGSKYDVRRFDALPISQYKYVKTEGAVEGTLDSDLEIKVYYKKDVKPEKPTETDKKDPDKKPGTPTSTATNAKLFISMGVSAASLASILMVLKRKNRK